MYKHLLSALNEHAGAVSETSTVVDSTTFLASTNPKAILITTAAFAKRKYHKLQTTVVEYAQAGGTVILCGQFCNMISPPVMDAFFQSTWSLPWKFGDYHRTTFKLNPLRAERLRNTTALKDPYSIKAVHIKGAAPEDAVYISTEDSRVQSMVFPSTSAHNPAQAPVLFTSVGSGYLGYIGDVNAEEETTSVILTMCGF